jgi:hypothetical protein
MIERVCSIWAFLNKFLEGDYTIRKFKRVFRKEKWIGEKTSPALTGETVGEESVFDDRGVIGTGVGGNIFPAGNPLDTLGPDDTSFGGACLGTSGSVVVTDTLDTLVGVDVIGVLTCGVIVLVYDRFDGALVDTCRTVDADVCNHYCHVFLLFRFVNHTIAQED